MKFRKTGLSNDLAPEGQEIEVWYYWERNNNGSDSTLQVKNIVNQNGKSIIWMLSDKYILQIACELEDEISQEQENAKSCCEDDAFALCTGR